MTLRFPTGWWGRAAALAIAVAFLAATGQGLIAPLIELYTERAVQIERRADLARHMSRVAAELPTLKAVAGRHTPASGALIAGPTDVVAAATLQTIVQQAARRDGIALNSIEITQSVATGPYRQIGIKLSTAGPWTAHVRFFAAIESMKAPRLTIGALEIRGAEPAGARKDLSAALAVYALRTTTPASGAPR